MSRVAVIGAGLSGLHVAREIGREHDVTIFDKARGPGGRMATRHAGRWHFDHGAQFFTARTAAFQRFLAPLEAAGVVAHWPARFAEIRKSTITAERAWTTDYPHYVGVPHMNAIGKHLAVGVDIRTATRIEQLEQTDAGWALHGDGECLPERYDWVVVTAPSPQAAELLPAGSPLSRIAEAAPMKSCFALMLGFEALSDPGFDAALVRDRDISWISVNSRKPGRGDSGSIVVHASNDWADAHLDTDIGAVREHMLDELTAASGIDAQSAAHIDVHRWRYANTDKQPPGPSPVDDDHRLAVCGDWLVRGRVESAFTSADRLLEQLRDRLSPSGHPNP